MARATPALLALAALCGCGEGPGKAFDEGFNESFRSSCMESTTKGGVPASVANQICDCGLKKIAEKYPGTKKAGISDADLTPIINECVNSVVQK